MTDETVDEKRKLDVSNQRGSVAALIVAAGRGHRVGGNVPKQYRMLLGRPVLRRTIEAFLDCDLIDRILVVIHPDDRALYERAVDGCNLPAPVEGGATRQDSVRSGLEALSIQTPEIVLIHDAARPFVSHEMIRSVIDAIGDDADGAIPALAITDSLKKGTSTVTETVSRENLWRAQTPQGFRYQNILDAHRLLSGNEQTDDAAVAEAAGMTVRLVPGQESNIKLTTPEDFGRAENQIGQWSAKSAVTQTDVRTGTGFDVHRFEPGDHVWLCGVKIPHRYGLKGHSDADAGLHAVTDALLGALGAGDIGEHFPPSDARWRDASSDQFLVHAASLCGQSGGQILHVDVTLICEEPRVGPHKQAMAERVAEILGIARSRVNIKATTTEGLGFTGRGEGLAAQATVTLSMPWDCRRDV